MNHDKNAEDKVPFSVFVLIWWAVLWRSISLWVVIIAVIWPSLGIAAAVAMQIFSTDRDTAIHNTSVILYTISIAAIFIMPCIGFKLIFKKGFGQYRISIKKYSFLICFRVILFWLS